MIIAFVKEEEEGSAFFSFDGVMFGLTFDNLLIGQFESAGMKPE